jgi:DNA-directed RNA polymerase subunit RPC12/RpoP
MAERTNTVCITCGMHVTTAPNLNRLSNGQTCPTCRDRVLDGLPSLLPTRPADAERSERMSQFDGMVERGEGGWPP